MSNLMLLGIITAAVIIAGYILSRSRIDYSRHLLTTKNLSAKADGGENNR